MRSMRRQWNEPEMSHFLSLNKLRNMEIGYIGLSRKSFVKLFSLKVDSRFKLKKRVIQRIQRISVHISKTSGTFSTLVLWLLPLFFELMYHSYYLHITLTSLALFSRKYLEGRPASLESCFIVLSIVSKCTRAIRMYVGRSGSIFG